MIIRMPLAICAAVSLSLAGYTVASAQAPDPATTRDQIQQARDLNEQALQLFKEGKYVAARPIAERSVALRETILGADHPDVATSLTTLGEIHRATGTYEESSSLHKRALAIREKQLGPEHPDTAASLDNLGWMYVFDGDYAQSKQLMLRGLAIREKVLGKDHTETARSLHHLGGLYYTMGEYTQASAPYQRALAIRETALGPEHEETAATLNNLALLYAQMGDYGRAEPLYLRALAIKERRMGAEHPDNASMLNNLAMLYMDTGAFGKSEAFYIRALAIKEKALGPDHPATAVGLNNLAMLYARIGAYAKAMPLSQRALAINEKVLGVDDPDTALSMNHLATAYHGTGAFDKAEPLYRQSLAILEKVLGTGHTLTTAPLDNLADLEKDRGRYIQAEQLERRILAIREKALGPQHPETAYTLSVIATLKWAQGKPTEALGLLQQAQDIQSKNSDTFLLSGSESRIQAYLRDLSQETHKNVSFSIAVPRKKSVLLGLTSVLQYKGRVLDAMSDSVVRLRKSVNAQDRVLFDQLAEVANQFSTSIYQGPGDMSAEEYRKHLSTLGLRKEALEADLAKRSTEFRKQTTPITIAGVSQAIPKDTVLVEWFRYKQFNPKSIAPGAEPESHYAAYVLKRGVDPVVVDMGDARTIDPLVHDFRRAISDPKRTDVKTHAAALSDKLLKPLRPHLKGSDHLVISPDGALNLVPMAALVDERGDYLAQHLDISYVTSGRDLLHLDAKTPSRGSAVVIADPEFSTNTLRVAQASPAVESQRSPDLDRGGLIFRPLTNTALEAQDIKGLLKLTTSNVFLNAEATEANIKQLHGPRILHIASHGFFLSDQEMTAEMKKRTALMPDIAAGENPLLRAGIALAGANARRSGATDDGILTALEVAQLDLHGTDLVVLSACDSGVGDVENGEGVYGLRRALVLAGSQTQVTSLWKVSDEATRPLMADFYKRLLSGEGRSTALRHAQQQRLANTEHSHPYYWASFVPFGNWAPLPALQ